MTYHYHIPREPHTWTPPAVRFTQPWVTGSDEISDEEYAELEQRWLDERAMVNEPKHTRCTTPSCPDRAAGNEACTHPICTCAAALFWIGRMDGRDLEARHCPACHTTWLRGYACPCGVLTADAWKDDDLTDPDDLPFD